MSKKKQITDPKEKAELMIEEIINLESRLTYIAFREAKAIARQRINDVVATLDELIEMQDSVGHAVGMKHWWLLVDEQIDVVA
jgi:hypothetical protein